MRVGEDTVMLGLGLAAWVVVGVVLVGGLGWMVSDDGEH